MEVPFRKPGSEPPKEPPMVHDYGMSPPIPITDMHVAMQEIESQGWDPCFAVVAGAVKNPSLILGKGPEHLPAVFIVFRSRYLTAFKRSGSPYMKIDNAPENGKID